MKAFFYTLAVTAVLIAAFIFLQALPPPGKSQRFEPRAPMNVKSEPARLPAVNGDVAKMNRDALFDTGVELLDLWHLSEAAGVFETVIGMDSTHVGAYLKLVECYSHPMVGLEEEAMRCIEKAYWACGRTRADTLWATAIGNLYVADQPDLAIDALKKLQKKGADRDELLFLLGSAYFEKGDFAQTERYIGDLLERDPSLGRAKELFVRLKAAQGDYGGAERAARDLASVYPEEPYPYVLLSQVLLLRGKIEEAEEFSNNALLLDPRYIPAIVSRAQVDAAVGEFEAARVSFEKLLLFDKPMLSAIAMNGIGYIDFLSGGFEQASRDMDEAIRLAMSAGSPKRGLRYAFQLIDYMCELGRPDVAETVLTRWVARSGDIPSRLGQLRILIAKGDIQTVRHGLERTKTSPEWLRWMKWLEVDYTDVYALSLIRERDFAGALSFMDAAAPASESPGRRAYLRGYAKFENGAAEEAQDWLAKARVQMHSLVFPYHGDAVLYVQSIFLSAEAALARGEGDEARRFYEDFLDMWDGADWDLQAVARARAKLDALSVPAPSG